MLALRPSAEGHAIRATARIIQVEEATVWTGLDRAAQPCRLVLRYVWPQLPVRECPWDDRWSVVHTQDEHLSWAKTDRDPYGDAWVWVAFAPAWRRVVACVGGKRTHAEANRWRERGARQRGSCRPRCLTAWGQAGGGSRRRPSGAYRQGPEAAHKDGQSGLEGRGPHAAAEGAQLVLAWHVRLQANVFWTKASIDPQILHLWLDTYQTGKDFMR